MILIRDVELGADLLDDAQLGARHHTLGHELLDGVGVDAQTDFLFLLLALDDVERLAQILRRLLVFPLPAGDEALGEFLLHCLVFAAVEAAAEEPGGQRNRGKRDDVWPHLVRADEHLAPRRLAGEHVEHVERHVGRDRQRPVGAAVLAVALDHQALHAKKQRQGEHRRGQHRQVDRDELGHHRGEEKARGEDVLPLARLARPQAAEVVVPVAFIGPKREVEAEHQPRPAVASQTAGEQIFFFPIADLDVDIGAVLLARRALFALRVFAARRAHAGGLEVGLFDDRDRAEEVAPGLAGKRRPNEERARADEQEERAEEHPRAVGEQVSDAQAHEHRDEDDEHAPALGPRRHAALLFARQERPDLGEQRQRTQSPPHVIAEDHHEHRGQRQADGPEEPRGAQVGRIRGAGSKAEHDDGQVNRHERDLDEAFAVICYSGRHRVGLFVLWAVCASANCQVGSAQPRARRRLAEGLSERSSAQAPVPGEAHSTERNDGTTPANQKSCESNKSPPKTF